MAERVAEHTPPQAISMNSEDLLASRMASKLLEIKLGEKIEEPQTIYRVLPSIRAEDNGAYDPKIISIGPFHRNNKELLPLQQLKWQFLHDLIQRNSSTNSLDNYIKVARSQKSRARNCYSGDVGPEGDEFVEMLVLDGCFIIEFLVKWLQQEKHGPLYAVHWILPHLRNELLLLENQLPFFVLQSLLMHQSYRNLITTSWGRTLTWLSLSYFTRGEMDNLSIPSNVSHLLQLFHFTLRPTVVGQDDNSNTATCVKYVMILTQKIKHVLVYSFYWCLSLIFYCRRPLGGDACMRAPRMIPSATELQEAGVQFKTKENPRTNRGYLDITFKDGVLEIPMLPVQAATIPLFQNLVAFEQCTPGSGSDFTSYVSLMDSLIDTSDDVRVLERCGILESKLGREEVVTKFFNSLRMGTYLKYERHYLVDLFTKVKEYAADESHQWRAMLVHDYFGNPWSVVSLIAAIVLLVLTAVQTIFTVYLCVIQKMQLPFLRFPY